MCPECRVVTLVPSGGLTQNFYLVSLIEARKRRPKEANSRLRMWCATCGGVALDRCADHRLSHLSHVLQSLTTHFETQHGNTAAMLKRRVREEGEKVREVQEAMEELERASSYVREKLEERLERSSLHHATVTSLLMEVNEMKKKSDTKGGRRGPELPLPPSPSSTGPELSGFGSLRPSTGSEGSSLTRSVSCVDSYGSNADKFGSGSDKWSYTLDRYGCGLDRYGSGLGKFGSGSDKLEYGLGLDRFTSTSDKMSSTSDKLAYSPDKFTPGTERSKSLPEKYNIEFGSTEFALEREISGFGIRTGLDRHVTGLERSNSSPAKYRSDPGNYNPDKRDSTDKLEKATEKPNFVAEKHEFGSEKRAQGPENLRFGLEKSATGSELGKFELYKEMNKNTKNFATEKDFEDEKQEFGCDKLTQGPENARFGLDKHATVSEPRLATSNTHKLTGKGETDIEKSRQFTKTSSDGGEMEGKIFLLKACLSSLRDVEGKVEGLEAVGGKGGARETRGREEREINSHSLINMFERAVRILGDV